MLKNLRLNRPLAVVDVETTGTDPRTDRVVEVIERLGPTVRIDLRTCAMVFRGGHGQKLDPSGRVVIRWRAAKLNLAGVDPLERTGIGRLTFTPSGRHPRHDRSDRRPPAWRRTVWESWRSSHDESSES